MDGPTRERRWLAEQLLSQKRDVIVGPLEEELAQILEEEAGRHTQSSTGHLNRRLRLYLHELHNDAKRGASLGRVVAELGKAAGAGIGCVTAATDSEARAIAIGNLASLR